MTKWIIFLLMMAPISASAECMTWGQDIHGNRICTSDDLVNRNPVFPLGSIRGDPRTSITGPKAAECDPGWTAVLLPHGNLAEGMCAKELRQPH